MDAVTMMSEDMSTIPDDELAQTAADAQAEIARRARIREAETTTDDMALSYLQAQGRAQGEEWVAPTGFIGSYPRGWRVTHHGAAFEASAPGVTVAPPGDGWTEADPDTDPTPFWEPGPYPKGALVRDAGQVWRALADDTDGPRPSAYPGGWILAD